MSKFIQTKDKSVREILKKNGLIEVSKNYGVYVFINDQEKLMKFNKNNLKLSYTNKINI